MNSTGAFRFAVLCAELLAGVLVPAFCSMLLAADCSQAGLSAQETVTRFKELDTEAESAVARHQALEAVRLYKEAICLVPDSARAFYGLGVAEAAVGDFVNARESLRTADRISPTSPMPLIMQVRVNFSLHDIETLKSNLREAADRFPRDAQLHDTLGRFLAEKNLFLLALAEALRSQQAGGADPASQVQLAVLENTVGAYADAIRNATSVEQNRDAANSVRASAAGIAGLSYESSGQPDQAIRLLHEAIQLDPSQENSYLALADLYEQSHKYAEAVSILGQAQTNVPGSEAVLLALGSDLIRTEHYQEGIAVLRTVLRQFADADQAYISIADACHKMGNPQQEVETLRALARYKPDYPMIHLLIARAMLSEEQADFSMALGELSLAEKSAPSDPDVFYLRGKIYISLGQYKEALVALRHSIELRPMEPSPYYQLARVYQKLGQTDMAREQFERIKLLESGAAK